MELLLCFVQEYRERWDKKAWKENAEGRYKAVDAEEREAEADGIDKRHHRKMIIDKGDGH
jgi:hypothetical protein